MNEYDQIIGSPTTFKKKLHLKKKSMTCVLGDQSQREDTFDSQQMKDMMSFVMNEMEKRHNGAIDQLRKEIKTLNQRADEKSQHSCNCH